MDEMITLTPGQTFAIKAYFKLWGPPDTFRVKQAEPEYKRVRNLYKNPVPGDRSSLNASLQDFCPDCPQYIGKGLVIWRLVKILGVRESVWSMHPPLREWLKDNRQVLLDDDIAVPLALLQPETVDA